MKTVVLASFLLLVVGCGMNEVRSLLLQAKGESDPVAKQTLVAKAEEKFNESVGRVGGSLETAGGILSKAAPFLTIVLSVLGLPGGGLAGTATRALGRGLEAAGDSMKDKLV